MTPTASTNSCWNSITSAIATLAASRPSATVSSVGAVAPSASSAQVLSGASPSIIRMSITPDSLRRPATTTSNVASSVCWNVGFTTHWPSIKAIRTEPTGPSNGRPARHVATDAAFIAMTS